MLPEISRRCLACGAAVRRGARFCYQCGADTQKDERASSDEPVEETKAAASTASTATTESAPLDLPDTGTLTQTWEQWDESVRARDEGEVLSGVATRAEPLSDVSPDASISPDASRDARAADPPSDGVEARAPLEPRDAPAPPPPPMIVETAADDDASAAEAEAEERGSRRRPATIVRENLRPRVEKMREASIVVMEDVSEDSGLRFVLIAIAFFGLFLLFLFVSSFLR